MTWVFNEAKQSELINALMENSGGLERVQAYFQLQEEKGNVQFSRKKALRYTKKQMIDAYGDDAEKVMKHKKRTT